MKAQLKVLIVLGALALSIPTLAQAKQPDGVPNGKGHEKGSEYAPPTDVTPGPKAGLPEKAKAYGRYCKGMSKKHVKGEKGTEFSRCVTSMAKAANRGQLHPKRACRGLSKKHVKGEKGTAFSQCVHGVNALRKQQHKEEKQQRREEREEAQGEQAPAGA